MGAKPRLPTSAGNAATTSDEAETRYQAFAPDGEAILGTVEDVSARACIIAGSWMLTTDGAIEPMAFGAYV